MRNGPKSCSSGWKAAAEANASAENGPKRGVSPINEANPPDVLAAGKARGQAGSAGATGLVAGLLDDGGAAGVDREEGVFGTVTTDVTGTTGAAATRGAGAAGAATWDGWTVAGRRRSAATPFVTVVCVVTVRGPASAHNPKLRIDTATTAAEMMRTSRSLRRPGGDAPGSGPASELMASPPGD
jgi:hypothetical protein